MYEGSNFSGDSPLVTTSIPIATTPPALSVSQSTEGEDQFTYDWLAQWPTDISAPVDDLVGGIPSPGSSFLTYTGVPEQPTIELCEFEEITRRAGFPELESTNPISPITWGPHPGTVRSVAGLTSSVLNCLDAPALSIPDTPFSVPSGAGIPFPPALSPTLDDERTLIEYYKSHLSSFFSIKSSSPTSSSSWNFYSYAILSTECQLDSPLRHGILAWTSAHLILTDKSPSLGSMLYRHYARARSATNDLLEELTMEGDALASSPHTAKKLNILLSTCLFLSFCDALSGDIEALADSLSAIKVLLESHWDQVRQRLGSLDSRILIWLSYLDLRTSFWKSAKPGVGRGRGELFRFLRNQTRFSSLRSTYTGRYYLTECFGPAYPEEELKEDLLHEPAKMLSDDALSIFSRILEFETWDDDMRTGGLSSGSLIEELRCAKLQAIQADIARARAVSSLSHCLPCCAELTFVLGVQSNSHPAHGMLSRGKPYPLHSA